MLINLSWPRSFGRAKRPPGRAKFERPTWPGGPPAWGPTWSAPTRVDEIVDDLDRALQPGDVVVTLGAGDIGNLAHGIAQRI